VTELGRVRLAEKDGAGRLDPQHRHGILFGDEIGVESRAARRADAARVDHVLERDRHAVQRAGRFALHHGDLGLSGGAAGHVVGHETEGVEAWIERLDAREDRLRQLYRRKLLVADERRAFERGPPDEILGRRDALHRA
jgi:hypothetical protein